jgi:long-chain acyl-CoA synthetase
MTSTAHELLSSSTLAHADRTALHWVDRDRTLTYAAASDAMARAAATLDEFGVAPGGHVGVFAHPGLDYVVAMLGSWSLGAAAALVDLAAKQSFGAQMSSVAPDAIIYTNDHFDDVRPAIDQLPTVRAYAGMDGPQAGNVGWLETLATATPRSADGSISVDGEATAIVTFGPDDVPVAVRHRDLVDGAERFVERVGLTVDDSTLCAVPLATRFHLEASVLAAFSVGATAGMLKTWDRESAWEAMDRHGTTVLCADVMHCRDLFDESSARGRTPAALRAVVAADVDSAAMLGLLQERFDLEVYDA